MSYAYAEGKKQECWTCKRLLGFDTVHFYYWQIVQKWH